MQGKSNPDRQMLDAAAFCRGLVEDGTVYAFLADHRGELFKDEDFADLFPSGRGRPSIPVEVICSVMVLQALEGLSDRDAIRQLRNRIDWKVACGLALDDEGFDFTNLTYWRSRLRRSDRPNRIFDAVRRVVDETGVLQKKNRRALDSTILDDAVATQDTVTQLISAIRRVKLAMQRLEGVPLRHDYSVIGKPVIDWSERTERDQVVSLLVNDAIDLLDAVGETPLDRAQEDAVGMLALVAAQDVEPGEQEGTWRIARRVAKDRVISTVDPEARHGHKSVSVRKDGFKAHLALEPDTGIVTGAMITPANAPDGPAGLAAHGIRARRPRGPRRLRLWIGHDEARPQGPPSPPRHQAAAESPRSSGRAAPRRVQRRPRPPHRHLPGGPCRPALGRRCREVLTALRALSSPGPLHDREGEVVLGRAE